MPSIRNISNIRVNWLYNYYIKEKDNLQGSRVYLSHYNSTLILYAIKPCQSSSCCGGGGGGGVGVVITAESVNEEFNYPPHHQQLKHR